MGIIIEDVLTVTMNDQNTIDTYTICIEGKYISYLGHSSSINKQKKKSYTVINGHGKIALPGLFNGHIHSDMTLARGLGDGLTLCEQDNESFVSKKGWFCNELNQEARYYSKLLQYVEAVKGGITFLCDVPFWFYGDELIGPFAEVGIKGAVVLDYRKDFLSGELINEKTFFETAKNLKQRGYMPIVEGPSEEHFDKDLLLMLKKWAEELDTFLQLHLAETVWRVEMIREKYGTSSIKYLHEIGFLNQRIIGSHGVYIDKDELPIVKETGTRIVNCPVAEMKISDGAAPVSALIHQKVPVGLGTDGALWNDSADMFSEMKNLMLVQRLTHGASSIDAFSCLYTATRGGAEVFGLEKDLGSVEVGKRACIVLLDFLKPHLIPLYHGTQSNVLQNIVSCARACDVDTVIIDGNIVVQNGILRTLDESALIERCQEIGSNRFKNLI